jgi:hypothetical protein
MANTKYDIELKKRRSILYLTFFIKFEAERLCPKLSQFRHGGYHNVNEYNMPYELLLKNDNYI